MLLNSISSGGLGAAAQVPETSTEQIIQDNFVPGEVNIGEVGNSFVAGG